MQSYSHKKLIEKGFEIKNKVCTSCGNTNDEGYFLKNGFISCCPERNLMSIQFAQCKSCEWCSWVYSDKDDVHESCHCCGSDVEYWVKCDDCYGSYPALGFHDNHICPN